MRRSRAELALTITEMRRLRDDENLTLRQIAEVLGYASIGTVSEHLKKGGHYSFIFNELEIDELIKSINLKPRNELRALLLDKLRRQ